MNIGGRKHNYGWRVQLEEINLWEERQRLVIKIVEHNLLKDKERLIVLDERLFQIQNEFGAGFLDKKEEEVLGISQKYPIDLNKRTDLDLPLTKESKEIIQDIGINKKIEKPNFNKVNSEIKKKLKNKKKEKRQKKHN